MAKKDVILKVTVDNSGLEFEDDVDFVLLTVPAELTISDVNKVVEAADALLAEEFDDDDYPYECLYDERGHNVETLMDEVCRGNDWTWRKLQPEIEVEII